MPNNETVLASETNYQAFLAEDANNWRTGGTVGTLLLSSMEQGAIVEGKTLLTWTPNN